MKKYLFLVFLFFTVFSNFEIYADCMFCGVTHKVQIELKNGSKITGYIDWNSYALDPYLGDSSPDYIKEYVKENDLIKNLAKIQDDDLFEHWAKLKTLALQKEYEGFGNNTSAYKVETFRFYKKIHEYPWGLGVLEKDFLLLKNSDLARITPLKQDVRFGLAGGIQVYTEKEIELLSKKPVYFIEFFDSLDTTMRVSCYDPGYSLDKLMTDIYSPGTDFKSLKFNGVSCSLVDGTNVIGNKLKQGEVKSSESLAILNYFEKLKVKSSFRGVVFDEGTLVQKLKTNGCIVQFFSEGD